MKGIQVDADHGTAFLAATQVFDIRPIARKWLALERTQGATDRFVESGTILVTCSGTVGRATVSFNAHEGSLISHDLLRVEPLKAGSQGWLYAFLRSSRARAMMKSAHYGHMIKHLEASHLDALPVPPVADDIRRRCNDMLKEIIRDRNEAHRLIERAEDRYLEAVGHSYAGGAQVGFDIKNVLAQAGRRRLDAAYNTPEVRALRERLLRVGVGSTSLRACGFEAWLPNRFLRVPALNGVELISSSALFEINPDPGDRIADRGIGDRNMGRAEPGWLLIARSGQIYGLVGSIAMATAYHQGKIISDHVIRLAPTKDAVAKVGYIMIALSHPTLGRPLMKALPTGSSIPSIDYDDLLDLTVPRFTSDVEDEISDQANRAVQLRFRADALENDLGLLADQEVARALA